LVHDSLKVVTQNSLLLSVGRWFSFKKPSGSRGSRFLAENTKTLSGCDVRVGMVDGASLGLELAMVEGLSLGVPDILG
jgi:hypothetical protein